MARPSQVDPPPYSLVVFGTHKKKPFVASLSCFIRDSTSLSHKIRNLHFIWLIRSCISLKISYFCMLKTPRLIWVFLPLLSHIFMSDIFFVSFLRTLALSFSCLSLSCLSRSLSLCFSFPNHSPLFLCFISPFPLVLSLSFLAHSLSNYIEATFTTTIIQYNIYIYILF